MTKRTRETLLVGIASIIAIAALIFGLQFLGGRLNMGHTLAVTVVFTDAHGVQEGGEVRMAGVPVGRIQAITLNANKEAEVRVLLEKRYAVPNDSRFVVTGSVLGNTSLLNIVPGDPVAAPLKDGDRVRGAVSGDLQSLLSSGETLIPTLEKTMEGVQRIMLKSEKILDSLNDPAQQRVLRKTLANIEGTTANLNATTASLPRLTQNAEGQLSVLSSDTRRLLRDLDDAAISGGRVARNGEALSANLNNTLTENRASLKALLQSADESASALAGLLNQAGGLIGDPELKKNIVAVTASLAETTARLESTTGNIEKLTGDPRLASDLRETVSNLKDTTESVKNLVVRVETIRIPGEKRRNPGGVEPTPAPPKRAAATSLIEPGLALDTFYDTTNPRFRADVSYTLRTGNRGRFYRAGLSDLSEGNGLNLQLGQSFGGDGRDIDFAYRYGLVRGKFGLGFDADLGAFDFRLDGYDPNRFTGDARGKVYLNRERTQSLLFGVEDLARDNRAVIGVQIRN